MSPKYSILIPTLNPLPYVAEALKTIKGQKFDDYEVIISDHNSDYEQIRELKSFDTANVSLFFGSKAISMAEHWEELLGRASGEWIIFLGQDDGLQHYFFELAEKLTLIAKENNISAIVSSRAYFFWPGVSSIYGNSHITYKGEYKLKICDSNVEMWKALLWHCGYHHLPQMYTNSLFHRDLIHKSLDRLNGKVFVSHPQDANLAALSILMEKNYLFCGIPLGWVGTSPNSAGYAVTNKNISKTSEIFKTRENYINSIKISGINYDERAGEFELGNGALYLWQSLNKITDISAPGRRQFLKTRFFKTILLACILSHKITEERLNNKKLLNNFKNFIFKNKISKFILSIITLVNLTIRMITLVAIKFIRFIKTINSSRVSYQRNLNTFPSMSILDASYEVIKRVNLDLLTLGSCAERDKKLN